MIKCRMQNAKCKVQNAKCKMQSAKCKVQSAKCKMQSAKCKMQNAKCKVQSAKCKVQNAKCKMQNAECKMQSAECRMQNFGRLDPLTLYAVSHLRWRSRLSRRGAVTAPEFGICNLLFIFLHLHSAPAECIVSPNLHSITALFKSF